MNTAVLDYSEVRILNNKMRRARQLRRRITLFCISVLLILFICLIFKCASSSAKDINDKTLYKYYKSVQVQYGDTLETIVNKNYYERKIFSQRAYRRNSIH